MANNSDEDDLARFRDESDDIKPIDTLGDGRPPVDFLLPGERQKKKSTGPVVLADGTEVSAEVAANFFDNEENMLHKGDYINLRKKVPSLRELYVAAGWEQKALEDSRVDVDLSCFLLDKNNLTRMDSDFLFYNNLRACEGAVTHLGDNRTGAGDGDNETISIDLNGIPFDVIKLVFVLSVYDENRDSLHLGQARNIFIRLVNKEDNVEIYRLMLDENEMMGKNVVTAINVIREGPKWFVDVPIDTGIGGLLTLAKEHGILIQEDTG